MVKPAPASLARFVSDRRFSDSGEHWTNVFRDNITRRNYAEEEELPVDYAFLDEDEEMDYNSVDGFMRRRKREAECELCLKTGLHVVYRRRDVSEDSHGDYSEYRKLKKIFSINEIFLLRHCTCLQCLNRYVFRTDWVH